MIALLSNNAEIHGLRCLIGLLLVLGVLVFFWCAAVTQQLERFHSAVSDFDSVGAQHDIQNRCSDKNSKA